MCYCYCWFGSCQKRHKKNPPPATPIACMSSRRFAVAADSAAEATTTSATRNSTPVTTNSSTTAVDSQTSTGFSSSHCSPYILGSSLHLVFLTTSPDGNHCRRPLGCSGLSTLCSSLMGFRVLIGCRGCWTFDQGVGFRRRVLGGCRGLVAVGIVDGDD